MTDTAQYYFRCYYSSLFTEPIYQSDKNSFAILYLCTSMARKHYRILDFVRM